jgi:hypothetical protein
VQKSTILYLKNSLKQKGQEGYGSSGKVLIQQGQGPQFKPRNTKTKHSLLAA